MDITKVINDITNWIKEKAEGAYRPTLVVGLSGGVDSAVAAKLCERTGLPLICLSMPNEFGLASTDRARRQAAEMTCKFDFIDISDFFTAYMDSFVVPLGRSGSGLVDVDNYSKLRRGNFAARLRTDILYDVACSNDGLVIGTCNLDELWIGYFTKGGDGMSDIEPLAGLHKSEVYELAKALGVIDDITSAAPSAELWDNQTDEDEFGFTYDELAWAINNSQHWDPEGNWTDRQKTVHSEVGVRHMQTEHKRELPPIFGYL